MDSVRARLRYLSHLKLIYMKQRFWWWSIFLMNSVLPLQAVQVTFQVDMTGQVVSVEGVHIAGGFSDVNGDGVMDNNLPNWNPAGILLSDGGNNIWSTTLDLAPGWYEYKFVNGNDWSNPEFFSADVVCPQLLNGNRFISVDNIDIVLPVVCWAECWACGSDCIDPQNPPLVPICLVTVDMETGKNHIVWEPIANSPVDQVVVFKETNALNVFEAIGQVDFSEVGVFEDVNSNPAIQANRYRIGLLDSCDYLYETADGIHKTIHLTVAPGLSNNVNLNWSAYEGIAFPSYKIRRGSSAQSMNEIATVASNILSYTDLNPVAGEWNYMVEIEGVSCNPNRSIVYSRSNVIDVLMQSVWMETAPAFKLSPNPVQSELHVQWLAWDKPGRFAILDVMGKEVMQGVIAEPVERISVASLPAGIYLFEVHHRKHRFQVVK